MVSLGFNGLHRQSGVKPVSEVMMKTFRGIVARVTEGRKGVFSTPAARIAGSLMLLSALSIGSAPYVLPCVLPCVWAESAEAMRKAIKKTIPDARKEILTLGEAGIQPQPLTIDKLDASVFFLNTTREKKLSLEIDFGKNRVHCLSPNLELGSDGVMRTRQPIGPKDFAIMCFPETGVYPFRVSGLEKSGRVSEGRVVIVKPGTGK